VGEKGSDNLKNVMRHAYIFFPAAVLLKDIVATMVVLSNEPGISAENVHHYHLALFPGGLLSGGAGWAWLFNTCVSVVIALLVSNTTRIPNRPSTRKLGN
jgi:hypothetical protein